MINYRLHQCYDAVIFASMSVFVCIFLMFQSFKLSISVQALYLSCETLRIQLYIHTKFSSEWLKYLHKIL